jgi:hypothetical protein
MFRQTIAKIERQPSLLKELEALNKQKQAA